MMPGELEQGGFLPIQPPLVNVSLQSRGATQVAVCL